MAPSSPAPTQRQLRQERSDRSQQSYYKKAITPTFYTLEKHPSVWCARSRLENGRFKNARSKWNIQCNPARVFQPSPLSRVEFPPEESELDSDSRSSEQTEKTDAMDETTESEKMGVTGQSGRSSCSGQSDYAGHLENSGDSEKSGGLAKLALGAWLMVTMGAKIKFQSASKNQEQAPSGCEKQKPGTRKRKAESQKQKPGSRKQKPTPACAADDPYEADIDETKTTYTTKRQHQRNRLIHWASNVAV